MSYTLDDCQIGGRTVYLATGSASQTVNVCTANGARGQYDWTLRLLPRDFVNLNDLQQYAAVNAMIAWLRNERRAIVETQPEVETEPEVETIQASAANSFADTTWIQRAMTITEFCIDELIREFLELPYLHRVEHSLHTRLYSILRTQPHFARFHPLSDGITLTQPIHKEWPETKPRPEKGNRRGNFDLAILAPETIGACDPKEFEKGLITAPIVIEIGLNYGEGHLLGDLHKLTNSGVRHGYLVHLLRERPDARIEEILQSIQDRGHSNGGNHSVIKIGLAQVIGGTKRAKFLDDTEIRDYPAGSPA